MPRFLIALSLVACTRTTVVDGDSDASEACAIPVPAQTDLSSPVWGEPGVRFYVPDGRWALATALASRQLHEVDGLDLDLSPSWFFASALEASFLGCTEQPADPDEPANRYDRQPSTDSEGCFELPDSTVWIELCRLFPDDLACEAAYADVIPSTARRDAVPTGALGLAWFDVAAYALFQRRGSADPDAFFAASPDPLALEKALAVAHAAGPWEPELDALFAGCAEAEDVGSCLTDAPLAARVSAVASHTADLEASVAADHCYDEPLTEAEVEAFVADLGVLWPRARVTEATDAALAVLDGGSFQEDGPAVLDAVADEIGVALSCPGAQLGTWYALECPP
ncbi:MAG: hypothetical protein EP330_30215 [Deltaproteobacteria bacterium]|nr:MAG: hypothetical protein EP330_30215 [Deltaproteobacteria bacterium]